jgi:hypothetical protein
VIRLASRRSWVASYVMLIVSVLLGVIAGNLARQDRWLEMGLVMAFTAALAWVARPPPARSGHPPESAPPHPDH